MEPKFKIMAQKIDGTIFECFTWCRSAETGIERAHSDAKRFGVVITKAWAEPV